MLPERLIGNCNRHIVLIDGEPVDGKYVIIVRNKTTTNSVVVIVSRIWCRHVLAGICMLICVPDFNHLPYFCGIWIYCDLVTYLVQLLSGWKCNCFVNACNCCNCLLVPLLEFGVTSPALSGTRWTVRLLFYVIRPLPHPICLPPLFWQQVYKFYACAQKPSQSLLKKKKSKTKQKNWIIYMYTSYLVRTLKIEEIVTLNTLMKPIFNWGRLASEIGMAARGVILTWLPAVTTVLGHGLTHWGREKRDAYIRQ